MSKSVLVCLLLAVLAECLAGIDICKELKCGTDRAYDACRNMNCPKANAAPASNGTTANGQTSKPSNIAGATNFLWPPYEVGLPNIWGYPIFPETMPLPYPMSYPPMNPFPPVFPPVIPPPYY